MEVDAAITALLRRGGRRRGAQHILLAPPGGTFVAPKLCTQEGSVPGRRWCRRRAWHTKREMATREVRKQCEDGAGKKL